MMTWAKFKEFFDERIQQDNLDEEIEIAYIDVSYPVDASLEIFIEDGQLKVLS